MTQALGVPKLGTGRGHAKHHVGAGMYLAPRQAAQASRVHRGVPSAPPA